MTDIPILPVPPTPPSSGSDQLQVVRSDSNQNPISGTSNLTTSGATYYSPGSIYSSSTFSASVPQANRTPKVIVDIVNASTVLTDEEVKAAFPAFQSLVSDYFAPSWGQDAQLYWLPKGDPAIKGHYYLAILDNADQAGALGYHDLSPTGDPMGKVFAGTDKQYNQSWTVTLTHELLEMLGDPLIMNTVFLQDANNNISVFALENCDAVESDELAWDIGGVKVTDFMTRAWWGGSEGPYDYCGHCTAPFQLLPGGYIGMWTPNGGWTQKNAQKDVVGAANTNHARPPIGSRRERRRIPRSEWIVSSPKD